MALIDKSIRIGGQKLDLIIEDVSIQQSYYGHHTFEVNWTIPTETTFSLENLKAVLGEKIEIRFAPQAESGHSNRFIGVVDSVTPYLVGDSRMVRMEGFSTSSLLDAGPKFRAFTEKSLQSIVQEITKEYRVTTKIDAPGQVPFALQCQESDYRFLCRMAHAHGLVFYYDGDELHFDQFNDQPTEIKLNKKDLHAIEASINLSPLSFRVRGYNYLKDQPEEFNSPDRYASNEALVQAAIEKSALYPAVRINVNYAIEERDALKKVEHQLATRQTNALVTVRGRSSHPGLHVGCHFTVDQKNEQILPGVDESSAFVITEINHSIAADNSYRNDFTAIPTDHPFPLNMPDANPPFCGPLTAIVHETTDPENLGRVRVRFSMDENEAVSPWMRVLTAYSSHGGSFWMPRKDEKVVVFFEDF